MGVSTVHETATEGYKAVGADYEKGRAGYPPEAAVFLLQRLGVIGSSAAVVEVAAGTGKFTRPLIAAGVRPVVVEPVAHMRETLASQIPGIEQRDGAAETMPFADSEVGAIVAAQAFHWFDGPATLREFHRVLGPTGGLGLVWNGQDRTIGWIDAVWREVDRRRGATPTWWTYAWREAFTPECGFSPLEYAPFRHDHPTDRAGVIARVLSISFIARQSPEEQQPLVDHILRVCDEAGLPERFVLPYNCHVYWCRRI